MEPFTKFEGQPGYGVLISLIVTDAESERPAEVMALNYGKAEPSHIRTPALRESCETGAFGALLPFPTSAEAFQDLHGFEDALQFAPDVSLDPAFDAPGSLDTVYSAVLIEHHDTQLCSEVMNARVTALPWGAAAVSARLREVFSQPVE